MAKTIPFPGPIQKIPDIDWTDISQLRELRYPKIPKKVQAMLQTIFDKKRSPVLTGASYVKLDCDEPGYPPDPIPIRLRKYHVLWLMELLDRFGGEISDSKATYTVRRKVKRHPVFLVQEVSHDAKQALSKALGYRYEYYFQKGEWRFFGRELPETDLAVFFAQRLEKERHFIGWFDLETTSSVMNRLREGASVEEVMMIG